MEKGKWFIRFYDRKDVGMNDPKIDKTYGISILFWNVPLIKFVFEFHNDLFNNEEHRSHYVHILDDDSLANDGIWLKVSLTIKKKSENNSYTTYLFEAICRNETNNLEMKEKTEFDHIRKAEMFIDYPIGLFYMCNKMIGTIIKKSSHSISKKISAADAIKTEKEKIRQNNTKQSKDTDFLYRRTIDHAPNLSSSEYDSKEEPDSNEKFIPYQTEIMDNSEREVQRIASAAKWDKENIGNLGDAIRQWTIDTFLFFINNQGLWPIEQDIPIEGYAPYWACYRIERYDHVFGKGNWILYAVGYKGRDAEIEMMMELVKGMNDKLITFMKEEITNGANTPLSFMENICNRLRFK